MSGADFIIAINLSVSGLLAAAFLALGVFGTRRSAAHWFALGFALGLLNFLFELALPRFGGAFAVGFGAFAAFLLALGAFNAGLAQLYGRRIPWGVLVLIFAAGCAARLSIEGLPRDLLVRQIIYQLPYAAMQAVGVVIVWSASRRRLDNLLVATLLLTSLHFLTKPLMASASGGVGAAAANYSETVYAMISQSSGTVLGLGTALLLFILLVRDMLEALAERSETDPLSGLLNRRGFEERRDLALRPTGRMPVSLVLCDLDHFKVVNDTYGHAGGDRVIVTFARILAKGAPRHCAVARIGGEEFAILLPGTSLAAARLFAETVRTAFAVTPIPGFAPGERFTASFGVAEAAPEESGADLQQRSDAALYAAKRAGRDCVRIALPAVPAGGAALPAARSA